MAGEPFTGNASVVVLVVLALVVYVVAVVVAKLRRRQKRAQRIPLNKKTRRSRFVYDLDVTTGVAKESGTNLNVCETKSMISVRRCRYVW